MRDEALKIKEVISRARQTHILAEIKLLTKMLEDMNEWVELLRRMIQEEIKK